jgi:hypothetical protein
MILRNKKKEGESQEKVSSFSQREVCAKFF